MDDEDENELVNDDYNEGVNEAVMYYDSRYGRQLRKINNNKDTIRARCKNKLQRN